MIYFVLAFLVGALTLLSPRSGAGQGARRAIGAAMLAGVASIAFGLDTGVLARLAPGASRIEERRVERLSMQTPPVAGFVKAAAPATPPLSLPDEGPLPSLDGAVTWLNGAPLTAEALRGKVVLVDFWTFGCINCRNALPHVREWHAKYAGKGLVVIGVHSPEFAYEKNLANVQRALGDLGIDFPVAVDNDFKIWNAFRNRYWPAHYFVDAKGRIRFHHDGEGEYEKSEQVIRQLLDEAKQEPTRS